MSGRVTRTSVVGALTAGMMLIGLSAASADADPRASCVGTTASQLASAGELDVAEFKALAAALGERNYGKFVSQGAKLHLGTIEACVPEAP